MTRSFGDNHMRTASRELVLVTTHLDVRPYNAFWLRFSGCTGTDTSELWNSSLQRCEPIDEITEKYVGLSLDS
jgi:hypothetical protein